MAKRNTPIAERLHAKSEEDEVSGCWNWSAGLDSGGYGNFYVGGKHCRAHRVSYETFVAPIPKGLFVLHECDNRRCVNPKHLFLGTNRDNMLDMVNKGRAGSQKLTSDQVLEIRNGSASRQALAEKFDISVWTVHDIRSGRRWTHI